MNIKILVSSLGQVGTTLALLLLGFAIVETLLFVTFKIILKRDNQAITTMLLAPALIGLFLLIVIPIIYEVYISFSNMNLHHFKNPSFGLNIFLDNIKRVFNSWLLACINNIRWLRLRDKR